MVQRAELSQASQSSLVPEDQEPRQEVQPPAAQNPPELETILQKYTAKEPKAPPYELEGNSIVIAGQKQYSSVDAVLLENYGCWAEYDLKDFSHKKGGLRLKCKACKVTLVVSGKSAEGDLTANLTGHQGKPHNWCNKTHLR